MNDPMIQADPKKVQAARENKTRENKSLTQEGLIKLLEKEKVDIQLRTLQTLEKKEIREGGGRVRRSVLQTIAEILEVPFDSLLLDGQVPWWIPTSEWNQHTNSPAALLKAEFGIVPFHGRGEDRSSNENWCLHAAPLRIRTITGRGGMGKTRLALELCRDMQAKGWRTGFLNYEFFQPSNEQWNPLLADSEPILLVLDYAESRVEEIAWLLRKISTTTPPKIRIILLARHIGLPGGWWDQLKSHRVAGDLLASKALEIVPALRPVTLGRTEREASYEKAVQAFSQKLGKPTQIGPPDDIETELYNTVLLLHIRALASIDGDKPKGENGILDYLLARERRFWTERLLAYGLDGTLLVALEEAMATITCNGGVKTSQDGLKLLATLPSLEGQPAAVRIAINNLLSDCYPGDLWIEPVEPDLFGERLFEVEFSKSPALKKAAFSEIRKAAKAARDKKANG